MTLAGFPHSGISGSTLTCSSPKLFAAYRALLRLSVPRHPPCALLSLDRICSLGSVKTKAKPVHLTASHTRLVLEPDHSDLTLPNPIPGFSSSTLVRECFNRTLDIRALSARRIRRPAAPTRCSRKEVIQPQVPLRLPCYDFAPVTALAFGRLAPCGLRHGLRALTASMA